MTGFEKLARQLENAQKALEDIGGKLGSVTFDPNDPGSIEAAIKAMEAMIDERVGSAASNPIIAPLVTGMKEQYRKAILERAATARLKKVDE